MFNRNSFGRPRAAHGFDADVAIESDLGQQAGRQAEYEHLAKLLGDVATSTVKAVAAIQARHGRDEENHTSVAAKCLKKARVALRKAECDDEDEDGEAEREGQLAKAESLIAIAKRNLLNAEEDDEDENDLAKAAAAFRKVAKSLSDLKAERAAKAGAPMAAQLADVSQKSSTLLTEIRTFADELGGVSRSGATEAEVSRLTAKSRVLNGSLREILDLVGGGAIAGEVPPGVALLKGALSDVASLLNAASRNAGLPSIAKAEGASGSYMGQITSMVESGVITQGQALQARSIANHLTLAKNHGGDMDMVRAEIKSAPLTVRAIFEGV